MTVDCRQARDRLATGEVDDAVEAHLEGCLECARVGAELAGLAPVPDPAFPGELLGRVEGALARERGPVAWLRSRPTPLRLVLAVLVGLGVPAALGVWLLRPDLGVYPVLRYGGVLVTVAAMAGAAIHFALRPLDRPSLGSGLAWAAGGILLLVAILPPAHQAHPASLHGTGAELVPAALTCLTVGLLAALPGVILLLALDRASVPWLGRGTRLATVAGGAAGFLALHLLCPITAPIHLVTGHVGVFGVLLLLNIPRG